MNDYNFSYNSWLARMQLNNRLKQSKYYPMYRKIFINRKDNVEDASIELIHERFHISLSKLTSGNMIYDLWRMLRVLNIFVDMKKKQYFSEKPILNENAISMDIYLSQKDDYVELGKLYLDIYNLFKKMFKLTVFVQEGAATYVSLHAPLKTVLWNKLEDRRTKLKIQLDDYKPYQFARLISKKWAIDKYGVQDTAKIVLDFPYIDLDLLSMSEEEIEKVLSYYDSKARWTKLLEIDDNTINKIVNALENHDLLLFFEQCANIFDEKKNLIDREKWLDINFFQNIRVHSVLDRCGIKVSSTDLKRIYVNDLMLNANYKLYTAILMAKKSSDLQKSFLENINIELDNEFMALSEFAEINFIKSRVTQFKIVKWFWEENYGGHEMDQFINFVGRRKHIMLLQNAAEEANLSLILPIDTEVDDLDSFLSPDMIVQIIIAIATSSSISTVIVEAIKSKKKDFSIKKNGNNIEINITNASDDDIKEIIEAMKKN